MRMSLYLAAWMMAVCVPLVEGEGKGAVVNVRSMSLFTLGFIP